MGIMGQGGLSVVATQGNWVRRTDRQTDRELYSLVCLAQANFETTDTFNPA